MKAYKALAVGIVLAGIMLTLQIPRNAMGQQAPSQDQAQGAPQDQPQGQNQDQPQAQPPQDQNQDQGQAPNQAQDQAQDQPQDQNQNQAPPQGQPQDQNQNQAPAQDPPGRAARLSYSSGSVSFQPGGEGDWVEAVNNRPMSTGDNLWADKDSRAELEVGSTTIRLNSETSVTFLDLDDNVIQLRLSQGSIIVRVRHLDDDDHVEVDTPNSAFALQRTGEYRIDVNADGSETDTTVWNGQGEVTGGGASFEVVAGQRASFTGTDQLNHEIAQIPRADDFDNWAFGRDHREDHSESANYISPEVTGSEDLDDNGSWHYSADYGQVWTPRVAVGWAPYRYGHWAWVGPWGWTWVEDEPWGFAPFHYGRWAYVGASWCWVPGPVFVRPVYAPALVAFVGGGGFRAGVAWFPLAPREVYVPWYRTSARYVTNVNVTNTRVNVTEVTRVYNTTGINNRTTNVTRITYANQRVPQAVTAVSHDTFVNARPVARNLAKVDAREIADAPVTHRIEERPERTSILGAGAPARVKPPARVLNRPVVAVRTPNPSRGSVERGTVERAPNLRPANPREAQPAGRAPNEVPRPGQPGRGNEPARPPEPANNRPAANIPRPGAEQPSRRAEPSRSEPSRSQPSRTEEDSGRSAHPLVRQAPPPQARPEQQRSEEQKFNKWQQQRPKPAPEPQHRSAQEPQHKSAPRPSDHDKPARKD